MASKLFKSRSESKLIACPILRNKKVYGLGYHLLVFVYEKVDDPLARAAKLVIKHIIFIEKERTGDWQTTRGIIEILQREGNKDDIVAFLEDRNFPLDEIGREALAEQILNNPPEIGYLTTSRALQPQSQYSRVISAAEGAVAGVENIFV